MNKITTKYRCSIPGCLEMEVVLDDEEVIVTITKDPVTGVETIDTEYLHKDPPVWKPFFTTCTVCGIVDDQQTFLVPGGQSCVFNCRALGLHLEEDPLLNTCVCESGYHYNSTTFECEPCSKKFGSMCD